MWAMCANDILVDLSKAALLYVSSNGVYAHAPFMPNQLVAECKSHEDAVVLLHSLWDSLARKECEFNIDSWLASREKKS